MALKRAFMVVASVSLVTLVSPQAALAAPADPVAVLQKLLASGHGVTISGTAKTWIGDDSSKPASKLSVKGVLAFDKGKLAAGEVTRVTASGNKFRFRVVGGVTYGSGGAWSDMLPAGKTWARSPILKFQPYELSEQNINIFEPLTLRKILTTTKSKTPHQAVRGVPATRYAGVITAKALCTVSAACRKGFGKSGDTRIAWQLLLDGRGRVVRLATAWTRAKNSAAGVPGGGSEVNTYYSGWGAKVVIKAPPAGQVAKVS
ncbi:hypothetical protein AB0M44_32940 [Streptosporangium subroseum]|uniref:hypothetical protein n=1 Tax=Streptosporangium subroseum TaxID=106412 RepID=UPI00342C93EC